MRLSVQETQVWFLVWEDPTCHGATKPVCHNYWACALKYGNYNFGAHVPQLWSPCAATTEAHMPQRLCSTRSHCHEKPKHCSKEEPLLAQLEKSLHSKEDPAQSVKNNLKKKFVGFSEYIQFHKKSLKAITWIYSCNSKKKRKKQHCSLLYLKASYWMISHFYKYAHKGITTGTRSWKWASQVAQW